MDGSQRNEHYSALSTQDWLSAAPREKPAVIAGETRWTWGDLEREATRLAGGLRERGVVPGDRVAALLGNNVGFVALVHACIRLEAVLVPLNTRLIPAEIAWQLNDSGARLLIAECGVRSVECGMGSCLEQGIVCGRVALPSIAWRKAGARDRLWESRSALDSCGLHR